MAEIVNGVKVPFVPIVQSDDGFDSIFQTELDKLKFSSHASKRLESRNIQLSETDLDRLKTAVNKAEAKGAKNSLVIMEDTAFIINIPNKTVVTALPMEKDGENIFTNIDLSEEFTRMIDSFISFRI